MSAVILATNNVGQQCRLTANISQKNGMACWPTADTAGTPDAQANISTDKKQ